MIRLTRKQRRELRTDKLRSRETELNIVSLIDVFAVLVFFLLANSSILAARLNVIGLNLPAESAALPPPKEEPLNLRVAVHQDRLEVQTRGRKLRNLPNLPSGYDMAGLNLQLAQVKRDHPKEQNILLALEPDIPYDVLIQIMDAARVPPPDAKVAGMTEMFPVIALGDAGTEKAK